MTQYLYTKLWNQYRNHVNLLRSKHNMRYPCDKIREVEALKANLMCGVRINIEVAYTFV